MTGGGEVNDREPTVSQTYVAIGPDPEIIRTAATQNIHAPGEQFRIR